MGPFYLQDVVAVSMDCSMAAYWYTYNCKWAKHVSITILKDSDDDNDHNDD